MIIKHADSRAKDILALESLLASGAIDSSTRQRIQDQIRNIRAGSRGEADAAYQMKVHFGTSLDWAIIHDLRIEHDGLVAQIDHLMINRVLEFWVCESKSIAQGVSINEHGEFTTFYAKRPQGMASPIEQNNRHVKILQRLLDSRAIELPTRLGMTLHPQLKSLVLISPGARVTRPKVKIDGLDALIKSDQLQSTIRKSLDSVGVTGLMRLISQSSLHALGHQVAALHRPIDFNWSARFGIDQRKAREVSVPPLPVPRPSSVIAPAGLICASCDHGISAIVAAYCMADAQRFKGELYCRSCQRAAGQPTTHSARG